MSKNKEEAREYVNGKAPLRCCFTTGYQRDLEVAREMVRLRRDNPKKKTETETDVPEPRIRDVA